MTSKSNRNLPPGDRSNTLTGRQVFYWFAAFFAVIIVTDIFFVRLAVRSFPGEEVPKSYYQGLNYNDVLVEKEQSTDLGWRVQLTDIPEDRLDPVIEIRIVNRGGDPIRDAVAVGKIVRPMTASGMQSLSFNPIGDGRYRARLSPMGRGAWNLQIEVAKNDSTETVFTGETRIMIE